MKMLLKPFRLLVALALMLAVPFQGIAASVAAVCMAMDAPVVQASVEDGEDGHGHSHSHESADQKPGDHHSDKTPDKGHCAPSVAAAAIASFATLHIPEFPAASVIAAMPASFSGIAPETLDRPPLSL